MSIEDRYIIETFEFLDAEIELPVNPDDAEQIEAALRWARREYDRYDSEYRMALQLDIAVENASIYRQDRDYIGTFLAALRRILHGMQQSDRERLAAWNSGAPIAGS